MIRRSTIVRARTAVCAGIALACAIGTTPRAALAEQDGTVPSLPGEYAPNGYQQLTSTGSRGDTKLYVIARQDDLTTSEGSADAQLKVSVPVAIHYVADAKGNLVGPGDNTVKFVNHTTRGAVHVSKIAVEPSAGMSIVGRGTANTASKISLDMRPVAGSWDDETGEFTATGAEGRLDDLATYASEGAAGGAQPSHVDEWNIAASGEGGDGALALNSLAGKVGGSGVIDQYSELQVGVVHWTIRAGTRAEADERAASVTIHYNANAGTNAGCEPVGDATIQVVGTGRDDDPVDVLDTSLAGGAGLVAPTVTNSDGSTTTYTFAGWSTNPAATTGFTKLGGLVASGADASSLAGKTFELFAVYTAAGGE